MPNALPRATAVERLTSEDIPARLTRGVGASAHVQSQGVSSLKSHQMAPSESARPSGYKSKYRGVSKSNADKWRVRVHLNGRQIHVGRY